MVDRKKNSVRGGDGAGAKRVCRKSAVQTSERSSARRAVRVRQGVLAGKPQTDGCSVDTDEVCSLLLSTHCECASFVRSFIRSFVQSPSRASGLSGLSGETARASSSETRVRAARESCKRLTVRSRWSFARFASACRLPPRLQCSTVQCSAALLHTGSLSQGLRSDLIRAELAD